MKKVNVADISIPLLQFVQELGKEAVILMHKRKPVAVIQPVWNSDVESVTLSLSPQFLKIIEDSKESLIRNGGLTIDEVRREFGLAAPSSDQEQNGARKRGTKKKKAGSTPASGDKHGR